MRVLGSMVAFLISSNTDAKRAKASETLGLPFDQLKSLGNSAWGKISMNLREI